VVDMTKKPILKPGSASYLTAQGPTQLGWAWVACEGPDLKSSNNQIQFGTSGEVTVRMQAGMEGVGFDQLVLSPAQYLEKPPAQATVKK